MLLETIIALTVLTTGGSCAAIDNGTNKMVWDSPNGPLVTTTYSDEGDVLIPAASYPTDTDTLLALIHAEDALQVGQPGHKVRFQCFKSVNDVPYALGHAPQHGHA